MNKKIRALLKNKETLVLEARSIADLADSESRDFTDDEVTTHVEAMTAISVLNTNIDREREMEANEMSMQGVELKGDIISTHDRIEDDPQSGFASFGEYLLAVKEGVRGEKDKRLLVGAAPTTFGNESSGADSGFVVPPQFGTDIFSLSLEGEAFLPLTDNDNVIGNSMSFPSDETTPWGSTGIRAYWEAEAAQGQQSKPVFNRKDFRLHKLFALIPMTDELLADATTLTTYVPRKAGESIRWKTNDAIINGTGAGQPASILSASAGVIQAKESGQAADTVIAENVVKMFSRALNPARCIWLINHDVFPQLPLMSIGNQPVFTLPSSGLQNAPAGLLLGRPILMTDTCQTVGDKGDIQFVDFMGYKTITKAAGVETATSMHLWFDYDVMAFRTTFRIDGGPMLSSPVSPANGSTTRSHFVSLAERT